MTDKGVGVVSLRKEAIAALNETLELARQRLLPAFLRWGLPGVPALGTSDRRGPTRRGWMDVAGGMDLISVAFGLGRFGLGTWVEWHPSRLLLHLQRELLAALVDPGAGLLPPLLLLKLIILLLGEAPAARLLIQPVQGNDPVGRSGQQCHQG